MQLTRKRLEMAGGRNRPTLNGADIDTLDYAEAIVAGFTAVYQLLQTYRDELLADDGPLARFADDEVRVILRATRTYALLLNESFHPDVLRDALDRDRLFDRLWAGVEHNAELAKFIAAERADLYHGDIPMFTTTPGSCDLWNSAHGRIADVFEESGLASVQRRLRHLSDADLEKQCWFIRASLATLAMGEASVRQSPSPLADGQARASRESLLRAARAVGDRLEMLALRGEQDASWIGLTYSANERWSLAPLQTDLYNGLPGVMLFLAYLGSVTGEGRYTALARAALATLRRRIAAQPASVSSIGAFDGWGGVIYALTHVAAVWNDPELFAEAEALVERIPDLLAQDTRLDVIGGAAGCIGGLLSLYHCTASQRAHAIAIQCGDRLLQHARTQASGIGWSALGGAAPLAGFSHGAAGIAAALLDLAAASGEARFRTAALDAIDYERTLFAPDAGNWRDLRALETNGQGDAPNEERYMSGWCHGAPGIGLGRLQALRHLDDAEVRAEIETAIKTTQAVGFGGNHSLCHGELGNLELLLQASQTFEDAALHERTYRIAASILDRIDTHGWRCGVPLGVETPGLMTGLAGIGYGLLRLAEPQRVPAMLVLVPPEARPLLSHAKGR
jgi:type 2 lantibiotic biosynthesis protein LanM